MASERNQIYKCDHCGITIEILHGGACTVACCGSPMTLLEEQTADSSLEKHVPVVTRTDDGVTVRVGSVDHPMMEKHWIEFVEVIDGDRHYRQFLNAGEEPEAAFTGFKGDVVARELCNLHGLWKG